MTARELPRPRLLALLTAWMLLSVACGSEQSSHETFSTRSDSSGLTSGTWQSTAALARARYFHTATPLGGGKVLVVGGSLADGSVLNHAELYDSATGKWVTTASLSQPRMGHSATLLSGGRILVVGGWNGSAYDASAELYDPSKGTWTATGSLNQERQYHTATELPDGRVLVTGGWNDNFTLTSAELYDPATGRWTLTGSLSQPRDSHTATLLPNGKVLVVGGWGTTSYLASAELYDPATGKWTATTRLNLARGYHTATRLKDGKVLVAGGYDESGLPASAALYDPGTGLWEATQPLGQARYYHTATLLQDGRVFVSGGAGEGNTPIASAELYDPATGLWSSTPPMAEARSMHTATLLPSGRVIAVGGKGSTQALSSAQVFVSGGDATAPETRIDSAPASPTRSTSATFSFSATESGATFECSWRGASFSACTSPATFQSLTEGSHTFQVRARDATGNVDATPEARTVTVDLTPPDTRLDSVPPQESSSANATFTFSTTEGGATFECNLDGAGFRACVSPSSVTGLSRGTHTFQVRARDAVGNLDATPASHTWAVLQALPAPAITSLVAGTTLSESQPTFSGMAAPGSTVIITLDGVEVGSTLATSSGEWRFTVPFALAEGEHTLFVTATYDDETNASSSFGPLRFTLDLSAAPPAPPQTGLFGCSTGAGAPSFILVWLSLLAVASARCQRRCP